MGRATRNLTVDHTVGREELEQLPQTFHVAESRLLRPFAFEQVEAATRIEMEIDLESAAEKQNRKALEKL